jgi:hypothetical protein
MWVGQPRRVRWAGGGAAATGRGQRVTGGLVCCESGWVNGRGDVVGRRGLGRGRSWSRGGRRQAGRASVGARSFCWCRLGLWRSRLCAATAAVSRCRRRPGSCTLTRARGAVFGGAGLSLAEAYAHPSLPIARTLPSLRARLPPLARGAADFPAASRTRVGPAAVAAVDPWVCFGREDRAQHAARDRPGQDDWRSWCCGREAAHGLNRCS